MRAVLVVSYEACTELPSSIFPDGLVAETLMTLALLFPQSDFSLAQHRRSVGNQRRRWFRNLLEKHPNQVIDRRLAMCGTLQAENRQIECFNFW